MNEFDWGLATKISPLEANIHLGPLEGAALLRSTFAKLRTLCDQSIVVFRKKSIKIGIKFYIIKIYLIVYQFFDIF